MVLLEVLTSHCECLQIFAISCQNLLPPTAHFESLVISISHLFSEANQLSLKSFKPVDSAADENWSSPPALFQCSSLVLMAKPVALSIGCWTGLRAKSFNSCSFLMHLVQIANRQYRLFNTVAGAVAYLANVPYANQTIRAFEIISFSPFFQLENQLFVNAGSALDEVSIPL